MKKTETGVLKLVAKLGKETATRGVGPICRGWFHQKPVPQKLLNNK